MVTDDDDDDLDDDDDDDDLLFRGGARWGWGVLGLGGSAAWSCFGFVSHWMEGVSVAISCGKALGCVAETFWHPGSLFGRDGIRPRF
jgi:hypothetical protein